MFKIFHKNILSAYQAKITTNSASASAIKSASFLKKKQFFRKLNGEKCTISDLEISHDFQARQTLYEKQKDQKIAESQKILHQNFLQIKEKLITTSSLKKPTQDDRSRLEDAPKERIILRNQWFGFSQAQIEHKMNIEQVKSSTYFLKNLQNQESQNKIELIDLNLSKAKIEEISNKNTAIIDRSSKQILNQENTMLTKLNKKVQQVKKRQSEESFDCKSLKEQIISLVSQKVKQLQSQIKMTVILANGADGKPNAASQIYVKKKLQLMPKMGIKSELITVNPDMTKQQMQQLIKRLNEDPNNTSTMIQLPFPPQYKFDIHQLMSQIDEKKNIDGFSFTDTYRPNFCNPNTFKPPTALGIATLISYYGVKTQGKTIAVIGKGALVGSPITQILKNYPYSATVINCDIYTENLRNITLNADIVIAACGSAELIKEDDIKEGAIIIDAGINQPITINQKRSDQDPPKKRKIVGDICKQAYKKSKYYTPVPGGVGLLTVASLTFNLLQSYYIQNGIKSFSLQQQLKNKHKLNKFREEAQKVTQDTKVLLISSAYNGLTQKIDKSLRIKGYQVAFQIASSDQAMRTAVDSFKPNIIICPTLMKAIPQDIYTKVKCLILHPGIKGDRGPSSIDWAILNENRQWGCTLLEADKQMDAGDIWGTENFAMDGLSSKVQIYNKSVSKIAEKLILQAMKDLQNQQFMPQKLDYSNPTVKGQLHRTILQSDPERTINWKEQTSKQIIKKSMAAETQPGLKVSIKIAGQKLTKFTYGYVQQKIIDIPSNIQPGQIFLRKHEAVCIKTIDGAVWVKQMRAPKNKQNPDSFKTPATIHLGQKLLKGIPQIEYKLLDHPNKKTFQEISFEKKGSIGLLNFDFYNGAMSTTQCERLAEAVDKISKMDDIQIIIFCGSQRNWSNGIHLNVIESSQSPQEQAWKNIKAINKIIKNIYKLSDKLTIAAIQANAGAGGVYFGLACDYCFAKDGIVLNPHYKNMGLYGSELHTATADRKFGRSILNFMKDSAQPLIVEQAIKLGVIDQLPEKNSNHFMQNIIQLAQRLQANIDRSIIQRKQKMKSLFKYKSIEEYEQEELNEMRADMFENRFNFAEKRHAFVTKKP